MGLRDRKRSDVTADIHVSVAHPVASVVEIESSRPAIVDQIAVMLFARYAENPLVRLREATQGRIFFLKRREIELRALQAADQMLSRCADAVDRKSGK